MAISGALTTFFWIISTPALATAPPTHVDIIIIGGGTTGLALANRLSEVPSLTIAVIETGQDESTNPNVTSVAGFGGGLGFNTHIDWLYETAEQTGAGGRRLDYHQGRAWGGTSVLNGMTYIRPQATQIDAWCASLQNPGWDWESLWPYYLKSESFTAPSPAQMTAGGASYNPAYHGHNGPVNVGYQYGLLNGTFVSLVNDTWNALGVPFNADPNGGGLRGFFVWPQTVDVQQNVREDACRAYFYPVRERGNLLMLRGRVDRIVWAGAGKEENGRRGGDERERKVVAEGVQYTDFDNGRTKTLYADKEVILSAGSVRSPAILELSGVGNPDILTPFNIPMTIPLPSVGENALDQPNNFISYTTKNHSFTGLAPYVTYMTAYDLLGSDGPAIAARIASQIPTWARAAAAASHNAVSAESIEYLFRTQHALIFNKSVPFIEILTTAIGDNAGSAFFILLPFSRGSVHVSSADPGVYPVIDPRYLSVEWDATLQRKVVEVVQRFWDTEPVKSLVGERVQPSLEDVPADATDREWEGWARQSFAPNHHLLGTAAMLPRELGGVVDPQLLVYGTENVRVVDASVLPTQVSGHLTSILYAVAERAADLVKERWGV
ncbi:GMC oxidoreductase [Aspergillus insuetus]